MEFFLSRVYFGNTVLQYASALGILLGCLSFLFLTERLLLRRLAVWASRTETILDDLLVALTRWAFFPLLAVGAVSLSLRGLHVHPSILKITALLWIACLTVFGVRFLISFVVYLLKERWTAERGDQARGLQAVLPVVKTLLWALGIIFFLDNAGVKISAVVTGLGIGGVAVALAAQAVLGDLFSYVAILFDRPFEIGDLIVVDDFTGTVEHIGLKTTRVRSLSGEVLVFSNSSLTASRIRNFMAMRQRRILFSLGLVYETPLPALKEVPGLIREIIEKQPGATFDRAHFLSFADSSLVFEIVYFVGTNDYNRYMDIQQEVNFRIKEEFDRRKIAFAYPTRTVYTAPSP